MLAAKPRHNYEAEVLISRGEVAAVTHRYNQFWRRVNKDQSCCL